MRKRKRKIILTGVREEKGMKEGEKRNERKMKRIVKEERDVEKKIVEEGD